MHVFRIRIRCVIRSFSERGAAMTTIVTTGLFNVQFAGGTPTVRLYISNFARQTYEVAYRVQCVQSDGSKGTLASGTQTVAGQSVALIITDDVQGQTVEVLVELPSRAVKSTVALVGTYAADGADEILLFVSPSEFVVRNRRHVSRSRPQRIGVHRRSSRATRRRRMPRR